MGSRISRYLRLNFAETFVNRSRFASIFSPRALSQPGGRRNSVIAVAGGGKISELQSQAPARKLLAKKMFSSANEMKGQSFVDTTPVYRSRTSVTGSARDAQQRQ